jgi:hypothetical protein
MKRLALCLAVLVCGCSAPSSNDAGLADAGLDAGRDSTDAGADADAGADGGQLDAGAPDAGWITLWNGVDFTGWQKWLGSQVPRSGGPVLGLENDPNGVFTIEQVDGEPAIHVTGETWGALTSVAEFGPSFELEVDYRWGTRVWPPLNSRDSGLMYLSTGPFGGVDMGGTALASPVGSASFMVSMEYQLVPSDVGGLYNLGPIDHLNGPRTARTERPGWNRARIVLRRDGVDHFLNDEQIVSAQGFTLNWPGMPSAPLTRGKLQLQSEGGEIYFRRVQLRPLP